MKCNWTNVEGANCDADAMAGKELCWFHDPDIEESRQDARRRGGRASRAPLKPVGIVFDVSTPEHIIETLQRVGVALSEGRCDRSIANTFGILAKNAAETHKIVGFEKRLKKIEERLNLREAEDAE